MIVPPTRYIETNHVSLVLNATMVPSEKEPTTFEKTVSYPEVRSWIEAMNEEMQSISMNDTWFLAPLLKGCKPLASKWIYKL